MGKLVPATEEHVATIYGAHFDQTVVAITEVDDEGQALAMGAIYPSGGRTVLVFETTAAFRQEIRRHTKAILQGARHLLKQAAGWNMPVHTEADTRYPRAVELIEHLGFRQIVGNTYEWRP